MFEACVFCVLGFQVFYIVEEQVERKTYNEFLDFLVLYDNVRGQKRDDFFLHVIVAVIENILGEKRKPCNLLNLLKNIPIILLGAFYIFLKSGFFISVFRQHPVVNVLWNGIFDEFLNQHILRLAILIKKHLIFLFSFLMALQLLLPFFFCGIDRELDNILVNAQFLYLRVYLFDQFFLPDIFLRTFVRAVGFRAAIIGMTSLDFGGDLESALSASHETAKSEISNILAPLMFSRRHNLLHIVKNVF